MANVFDELTKIISDNEPDFWIHALSKVVSDKQLDNDDYEEIIRLLKVYKEIQDIDAIDFEIGKCEVSDLIVTPSSQTTVALKEISEINNINALTSETKLTFSSNGFTVVYGDNGAGKSGYARILTSICRFRGVRNPILPNIYTNDTSDKKATIKYYLNDLENEDYKIVFPDEFNSSLKDISIFDRYSATEYIEKKNEVAFRPFVLNVLDEFTNVLDEVKHQIETEIEYSRNYDVYRFFESEGNEVRDFIHALSKNSSFEKLEELIELDEKIEEDILEKESQLAELKSKDITKKINEIGAKTDRYSSLKKKLVLFKCGLNRRFFIKINELTESMYDAMQAAKLASVSQFDNEPLTGIGTNVWRKLWEHAREYSKNEAYPEKEFPYVIEDARCVLCQQELDLEAKKRLSNFEDFVRDRTQAEVDRLETEHKLEIEQLEKTGFILEDIKDVINEIEIESLEGLASKITTSLDLLNKRKQSLLYSCSSNSDWDKIESLPSIPLVEINSLIINLKRRKEKLEELNTEEKVKNLEKELSLLKDKKKLKEISELVKKEIDRLQYLDQLDLCTKDLSTSRVTRVSNSVTEQLVTESLRSTFESEIKRLGFHHFDVVIEKSSGSKAVTYHTLKIKDVENYDISQVLSEGEYRCIALAYFLAEIITAQNNSGIILDDPVTSLDHKWSSKIAFRLFEESKKRQVIVFTHDLTFLKRIVEISQANDSEINIRSINRRRYETGIVSESSPWDSMNVKQRVGVLKQRLQRLKKSQEEDIEIEFQNKVKGFYGSLRETWEALVEELLLNQVVVRFGREVQTQRLSRITDIKDEDIEKVATEMSKCSTFMEGHDSATALHEQMPDIDQVKIDLDILDEYRKELQSTRKRS